MDITQATERVAKLQPGIDMANAALKGMLS